MTHSLRKELDEYLIRGETLPEYLYRGDMLNNNHYLHMTATILFRIWCAAVQAENATQIVISELSLIYLECQKSMKLQQHRPHSLLFLSVHVQDASPTPVDSPLCNPGCPSTSRVAG